MKHNVRELYAINGEGYYTEDYLTAQGLPKRGTACGVSVKQRTHICYTAKGYITITTAEGERKAYTYGEKTIFDSEEERNTYRERANEERAERAKRTQLLKAIANHYEQYTTEDLQRMVEQIRSC